MSKIIAEFSVWFPLVSKTSLLAELKMPVFEEGDDRWLVGHPTIQGHQKIVAKKLLIGVRAKEGAKQAHQAVVPQILGLPEGSEEAAITENSWQLAMAVADRMARLNPSSKTLLVATGAIDIHEDILTVSRIEYFTEKLQLLAQSALTQAQPAEKKFFLFPAPNQATLTETDQQLMQTLTAQGWELWPVEHLDELALLWEVKPETPAEEAVDSSPEPHFWQTLWSWLFIAALVIGGWLILDQTCLWQACDSPIAKDDVSDPTAKMLAAESLQPQFKYRKIKENYGKTYSLSSGAVLHHGDQFKVYLTPTQDSYVYLYYLDSSNQLQELFDNVDKPHLLEAATEYILPSAEHSFTLDANAGLEYFYLLAFNTIDTKFYPRYLKLKKLQRMGEYRAAQKLQSELLTDLQSHQVLFIRHQAPQEEHHASLCQFVSV